MRIWSNKDGFTVIEVLVGMLILTVISLGLMNLTVSMIRGHGQSQKLTTATTLAQDQIERAKRLGYLSAQTAVGTEDYGTIANFPAFKRVTAVATNTPAPAMKTLIVTVLWASDTHMVATQTIFAE